MKLKVKIKVKGIYRLLLDFITIGVLNIEQQHPSSRVSTDNICLYGHLFYDLYIYLFFSIPWNFCSTRTLTTKNVIFGNLILDPLTYTNMSSRLVTNIWRHDPGYCARLRPISSLRKSLLYIQIRYKSFYQKIMSL